MFSKALLTITVLNIYTVTTSATLSLAQNYEGSAFFDGFDFRDAAYYHDLGYESGDPTDGFVKYLDKRDAQSSDLISINSANQVYIGVDHNTVFSPSSPNATLGRPSVRLESTVAFSNSLIVADIAHMPSQACGVWPALWMYNFNEDPIGEVDIIEGAMFQENNIVSLHTCGSCEFTNIGGLEERSNCALGGAANTCDGGTDYDGCGATGDETSYGDGLNGAGGGVYATYIESNRLRIWNWPSGSVPSDIGSESPDPVGWGAAGWDFQQANGGCDVGSYFKDLTLIINIDFCGSGVGEEWWTETSSCSSVASTCADYVAANPSAYSESYWLFNSIKVYQ